MNRRRSLPSIHVWLMIPRARPLALDIKTKYKNVYVLIL
jgi:hypothetical protein